MITDINIYKEFTESMISLSLNFVYMWKIAHHDEKISEILNKRTLLPELLQLSESEKGNLPAWCDFLTKAEDAFSNNMEKEYFEKELKCLLQPFANSRFDKYYESRMTVPARFNAGSLKYDAPLDELPPNYCNFHIANILSPKSFFEDPEYLANCFIELMNKSEKQYAYDTLRTFTWLNSRPRWLSFFPQEWRDNMSEPDNQIFGNLSYWGQLITAGGTINKKMEEYVRIWGILKYKTCKSHCSFKAMREHLNKYLLETENVKRS